MRQSICWTQFSHFYPFFHVILLFSLFFTSLFPQSSPSNRCSRRVFLRVYYEFHINYSTLVANAITCYRIYKLFDLNDDLCILLHQQNIDNFDCILWASSVLFIAALLYQQSNITVSISNLLRHQLHHVTICGNAVFRSNQLLQNACNSPYFYCKKWHFLRNASSVYTFR